MSSRNTSAIDLTNAVATTEQSAGARPSAANTDASSAPASGKKAASAGGGGSTAGSGGGSSITAEEERAKGAAKSATYLFYLRAAGGLPFASVFMLLLALYSAMNPMQSLALKHWMDTMVGDGATQPQALVACGIYTLAATGLIGVTLMRNVILPYASVAASRKLHGGMMHSVMRATIAWYEATPLGRILNRFSSDISAIDQQVASQFKDVVVFGFNVVGIALVCSLGTGDVKAQVVVLSAVAVASLCSWGVYSIYRVVAREQKRLESVSVRRSCVHAQLLRDRAHTPRTSARTPAPPPAYRAG